MEKKFINSTIGRRKTSVARVSLQVNAGSNLPKLFLVNGKSVEEYFQYNLSCLNHIYKPLNLTELLADYKICVIVKGGGFSSQAGAIMLGLARALAKVQFAELRPILKKNQLLRQDARIKERRKYGLKKARKASQYSKR